MGFDFANFRAITGWVVSSVEPLSDGITKVYKVLDETGRAFVAKFCGEPAVLSSEVNGLNELRKAGGFVIPEIVFAGDDLLVTTFLAEVPLDRRFATKFAECLALQHQVSNSFFGFFENNTIGASVQQNIASGSAQNNWTEFWFQNRLLFQFRLLEKNGLVTDEIRRKFSVLEHRLDTILSGSTEKPALLHGDLWRGNYICMANNKVGLIDPAVYYGHREAEFGLIKLFGGLPSGFYDIYNEIWPLLPGWAYRNGVYQLYHLMNHLNLFGKGYYAEVLNVLNLYTR